MVGLPCLVSQCDKLHVAGLTWVVFSRVYLESCISPTLQSRNFWINPRVYEYIYTYIYNVCFGVSGSRFNEGVPPPPPGKVNRPWRVADHSLPYSAVDELVEPLFYALLFSRFAHKQFYFLLTFMKDV
jgi:hypothetical protein